MSARLLLFLLSISLLTGCGTIDTTWLWTGVRASDQAEIRAAARAMTNSTIVEWQVYPDNTKPTHIIFYTEDGKMYRAQKMGGKWQIQYIPEDTLSVLVANDLTNRCS